MIVDAARRLAEPAEKLLTQSFRFAGWVVGRTAAPVVSFVNTAGRPVMRTVSTLSQPAVEKLFAHLPGARPSGKVAAPPTPPARPVRPPHVAVVPSAADAPTPAAAHAEADALLAKAGPGHAPSAVSAEDLPVADWDGLTIAAIRQRTRKLTNADVLTLLAYERAHAARPAVILNLENRLAKQQNSNGALPKPGI